MSRLTRESIIQYNSKSTMVSTASRITPLKKIGIWLQAHLYLFFSMLRAKKITRSFLLCSIRETWGWIDWGSPIVVRAFGRACHKKILIFIMRIIITIINYKQHVNARETQRKHYCLFFFANLQKIFLLYIYASHSVQARVTSYGLGSPLGIWFVLRSVLRLLYLW